MTGDLHTWYVCVVLPQMRVDAPVRKKTSQVPSSNSVYFQEPLQWGVFHMTLSGIFFLADLLIQSDFRALECQSKFSTLCTYVSMYLCKYSMYLVV